MKTIETINRPFDYTVEKLWAEIHTDCENIDTATEAVRSALSKAERVYKVGILATGEIREESETGHYYDGDAVTGERLDAIVSFVKKEGNCILTMDGNRITNVRIFAMVATLISRRA